MQAVTIWGFFSLSPHFVTEDDPVKKACSLLAEKRLEGLAVIDAGGRPVGIFTPSEAVRILNDRLILDTPMRSVELAKPVILATDTLISDILSIEYEVLPILLVDAAGHLCGSIGAKELRLLYQRCNELYQQKQVEELRTELENTRRNLKIFETVLEHAYEGILITDENGYIKYINEQNAVLLGVKREHVLGKHVTSITEKAGTHLVLKTRKPQIGAQLEINGRKMVVNRIPIIEDGRVIAGLGMVLFKDTSEIINMVKELNLMHSKVEYYRSELEHLRKNKYSLDSIVGQSDVMKRAKDLALKVAMTDATVLILGESGTGKELFAHAIHQFSPRRDRPFIRVNCAALPKDLLESELFGYEEGAFTGALKKGRAGKFELAEGGTVFLDEIGDMHLEMQAKLLRVLQEKEIDRIGGSFPIKVDFRLIAATNQDLARLVSMGRFRHDLFYRLNVCCLQLPPLRERKEDIAVLSQQFLRILTEGNKGEEINISEEAMAILRQYDWPGNVRELFNVLQRAVTFLDGYTIRPNDLGIKLAHAVPEAPLAERDLKLISGEVERKAIEDALRRARGNKCKAADLLGIHRSTLYEKIRKYGIIH